MRLNEILEENSIKAVSEKTKISEENLEDLLGSNFDRLKKIKVLGFISIIEREYQADLSALRDEALAYYGEHKEDDNFSVRLPVAEEKKKRSKLFILVVLALLAYASWYFFTQFDKKHLGQLIPFMEDQMIENVAVPEVAEQPEERVAGNLSIESLAADDIQIGATIEKTVEVQDTNTVVEEVEEVVAQEGAESSDAMVEEVNVSTEPVTQF
ncbi:MAG TPA: hypothetical protein VIM88_02600 [Sulfurovum sp.]|uniref:hypothetical protein n=1 Tax=Sulfurovum sp. TaxID=1969726 RepID=UPI002F9421CB